MKGAFFSSGWDEWGRGEKKAVPPNIVSTDINIVSTDFKLYLQIMY